MAKKARVKGFNLPNLEVDSIYALRNAFAHDYSLYNIHPTKPSYTHHFRVLKSPVHPLVRLPQVQWDGNINNRTPNNMTVVNLEALGDTVEGICAQLLQLADENTLEGKRSPFYLGSFVPLFLETNFQPLRRSSSPRRVCSAFRR